MRSSIIALITDFGTEDGYVGAMKGRILTLNPSARIVDISHEIPPFDVRSGAFCLFNSYAYFPEGTIFVVVVDPGVGTRRRGLVLLSDRHVFIGPDNGVFSLILKEERVQAFRIREEQLPGEISPTFHGRDVFAPLAAWKGAGQSIATYLEPVGNPESFWEDPKELDAGKWQLRVLHIDHFGNIILNLRRKDLPASGANIPRKLEGKDFVIQRYLKTFGEAGEGELAMMWDSSGFLQIARNQGHAAETLGARVGDPVILTLGASSK
ncbi:MAG: SAM-dependent chlorinase/fluorinase [Calditrichaeota bacterium]|nr:SAM-dependent chlorinase/fluorinase [Calditrichota bacterium]